MMPTTTGNPGAVVSGGRSDPGHDLIHLVLEAAESAIGTPYSWGGNTLAGGVDCSGLVQQAFRNAGIELPRVSNGQAGVGQEVGLDALRPGDLVWWDNSSRNQGADHIAIYVGGGLIVEAPRRGQPVRVTALAGRNPTGARRVLGVVQPTSPPGRVMLGRSGDRLYTTLGVAEYQGQQAANPGPTATVGADEDSQVAAAGGGLGDDLPADASPEEVDAYIRQHFPSLAAFMGNAEIRDLLHTAAREDWSFGRLQGAVEQTEYWRTHPIASRNLDVLLAEDPAEARRQIEAKMVEVDQAFRRQGVTKDRATIGEVAKNAIRGAWTPKDLERIVADDLKGEPLPAGQASANADVIMGMARSQGLPLSRQTAEQWALDVAAGRDTTEGIRSRLTDLAKDRWRHDPNVLGAIAEGRTAADHFSAYRDKIAQTLELHPDDVDLLNDTRWKDYLETVGEDGKKRPTTWGEMVDKARHDPRAKNTTWWRQEKAATAVGVLRFLGEEV